MKVQDSPYDLEIRDADGRRTLFGILNEQGIDKVYLPGLLNGFNAIMALGIVGALAYVAEEPEIFQYLEEQLITTRDLPRLSRDNIQLIGSGISANFSNYNMAFAGGFLASRYLCNAAARATIAQAIHSSLYDPGTARQPVEQEQTLYDSVQALAQGGATAFAVMSSQPDADAVRRGTDALADFPDAPLYNVEVVNCDPSELAAGVCNGVDGSTIQVAGRGLEQ